VEVQFDALLILGQNGGDWPASWPSCYNSGERHPGVLWLWGWVGPAVSGHSGNKKNTSPSPGMKPIYSIVQPIARSLSQLSP